MESSSAPKGELMKSKRLARNRATDTKGSHVGNSKQHSWRLTRWIFLAVFVLVGVAFLWKASLSFSVKQSVAERVQRRTTEAQFPTFDELSAMPTDELETQDIAILNLRAATSLPGSQQIDIADYLKTLDNWARQVERETLRNYYHYTKAPEKYENSDAFFRMLMLVTVLQQDFGVRYNPDRIRDIDFRDSNDLFIHGMIGNKAGGTCVSMPALYVAVGRRLGYPLFLVNAKQHIFCRWESSTETLNIEATSRGLVTRNDNFYMTWPKPIDPTEVESGQFLKSLTTAESFAAFLAARGHCLEDNGRASEAIASYSMAVRMAPHQRQYRKFLTALRSMLRGPQPTRQLVGTIVFNPVYSPRTVPKGQAVGANQSWQSNHAFGQLHFNPSAVPDFTQGDNHGF